MGLGALYVYYKFLNLYLGIHYVLIHFHISYKEEIVEA